MESRPLFKKPERIIAIAAVVIWLVSIAQAFALSQG